MLRRLAFGVYRRGTPPVTAGARRQEDADLALLTPYRGRWVAQEGNEVLFDAEAPEPVVRWLRRHGRSAGVWLVPSSALEAGSALSAP